ncbi:MAG: hypothetical protein N4A44_01060 [Alphaproteobacteria bacterium]|jgi:hypothetical protein|nr:hypothetical protein [Alphaproteobacteria bacterium]
MNNLIYGFLLGIPLFAIFFYAMFKTIEKMGREKDAIHKDKAMLLKSFILRMLFVAVSFYIIVKQFNAEGLAGAMIAFIIIKKISVSKVKKQIKENEKS